MSITSLIKPEKNRPLPLIMFTFSLLILNQSGINRSCHASIHSIICLFQMCPFPTFIHVYMLNIELASRSLKSKIHTQAHNNHISRFSFLHSSVCWSHPVSLSLWQASRYNCVQNCYGFAFMDFYNLERLWGWGRYSVIKIIVQIDNNFKMWEVLQRID